MKTIEEITAAMQAISDLSDAELTDEKVLEFEALEVELKAAQNRAKIRDRSAALNTVVVPAGVPKPGAAKATDSIDKAFNSYLRTGQPSADIAHLAARGRDAQPTNAQGEGTPSAGGYLVPDGFRTKLVERMKAYGGIAQIAEEFNTSDGRPVEWPTINDTSNVGEIVAEHGTFASGADMTFGTADLGAYKYMSGGASNLPVRVSVELLQDAAFDVEALVTRLLGIRIGRIQATHLATGNGSGQPLGLVYGLTGIEIAADTAGITYDDLVTFVHSVDPAYRGNARWVFNDLVAARVEKIKDSHGDPIFLTNGNSLMSSPEGTQRTLLGYPVTIDQALPDITVASNTINWGAFGDIREGYVVRRVRDVQVVVNPYSRAAYGEVEFHAWARMDATQQNTGAYVALTGEQ